MTIKSVTREAFNKIVNHPLQSFEWGEFREKTGVKVIRQGMYEKEKLVNGFQLTIHPVPRLPWTIGYLPKGNMPDNHLFDELKIIGANEKSLFIQLEPLVIKTIIQKNDQVLEGKSIKDFYHRIDQQPTIVPSAHPLFTKFNFVLDITPSEEDLLKNMHPKARYNIRVSQKHNVTVTEDNSPEAFEEYLKLTNETTTRQKFYAHSERYHRLQWETLPHKIINHNSSMINQLSSHLLTAKYQNKILATWILFVFKDTLYYPYGASSNEHREVMASNAIMWEAIRFGKKLGLKKFDMWGALGLDTNPKDPWFGFHDFKRKYGPDHIEYVGSYDYVIKPVPYQAYKIADKLRWFYLKLKK